MQSPKFREREQERCSSLTRPRRISGGLDAHVLHCSRNQGRRRGIRGPATSWGRNPKLSVINAWHQAHDVPNLFVVDGSSFVMSGAAAPAPTIGALALCGWNLAAPSRMGVIKTIPGPQ